MNGLEYHLDSWIPSTCFQQVMEKCLGYGHNFKYHSSKLELLVLKWAECNYFKEYLY